MNSFTYGLIRRFLVVSATYIMALLLVSCAVARVEVPLIRPAEINTTKFKRVYVGDFKNATSLPNPSGQIEFALTQALQATNKFEVLDKEAYETFVKSSKSKTDDVLVINGTVSQYKGGEEVTQGKPYTNKEGKTFVDYTRTAGIVFGTQFKVSQASNAHVIGTREITKNASTSRTATNAQPPYIDMEDLVRGAQNDVVIEFLKKILPYREIVTVELYKDEGMPELEQGINAAKRGEWEAAITLFSGATEKYKAVKPEQQAAAFYDLGIAHQFSYRFADAKKAFSKALTLDDRPAQYKNALNECALRESEYKKLKEQQSD